MLGKLKGDIQLLDRHIGVMKAVMEHEPIGIVKLSLLMDLPYHRIRYSLRVLEQMGYIQASPSGAITTGQARELLGNLDRDVDELISLLQALKRGPHPPLDHPGSCGTLDPLKRGPHPP